jgi:transposase-like protein
MTTTTRTPASTTNPDPCPRCDRSSSIRWVSSTPGADTWACRDCGTEWTITVEQPAQVR